MKFKYPKKIIIGSIEFKLIYDKETGGGAHFSYRGDGDHQFPHIFFGLKDVTGIGFLEMVIHELKEIIHGNQDTMLTKRNDEDYLFCYTHAEHTDLCARLAGHLKKFIK